MEKTIHLEQGEYRDEKIKVYVGKEGTDIVIFGNTLELVSCNEETKDYSEEFTALQERFDALKETIERKVYLELQFQSRRINELEKTVNEKKEKEIPEVRGGFRVKSINGDSKPRKFDLQIEAPRETKAVEKAVKKLEEFNPEFYEKTSSPQNNKYKRLPALSLEEVKERILNYGREKDNGSGFTFRYGANRKGKFTREDVRKERHEILLKVSGDTRKVKTALDELLLEEKLIRKLALDNRTFLYFLNNNGQATVKENIKNFEGEITDEYWTKDAEGEEKLFPFKKNIEEEIPVIICPRGEFDELIKQNKCPRCGGKLLPVDLGSENIEAYACDTLSPTKSCLICGQEYYGKEEEKEEEPCII